eukprot:2965640-Pyramimonas_sp.AAC.1
MRTPRARSAGAGTARASDCARHVSFHDSPDMQDTKVGRAWPCHCPSTSSRSRGLRRGRRSLRR